MTFRVNNKMHRLLPKNARMIWSKHRDDCTNYRTSHTRHLNQMPNIAAPRILFAKKFFLTNRECGKTDGVHPFLSRCEKE